MGLLEDFRDGIESYETNQCKTEIVDFAIAPGGGTVLDTGDIFQFKVRVLNQGQLDMKKVTVRANGTTYADVALSTGSFGSHAVCTAFNLDSGQSYTTGFFRGKAKAVTGGSKDIVTAQIQSWDASLDHILVDHTGAGVAEGKLNKEIRVA
jgi:hypothetical protein